METVTVSIAGSAEDSVSLYESYKARAPEHSWGRFNPDVKRCLNYAPACIQLASCCTAEAGLITHGAGLNSPAAAASVSGSNTLKKKPKKNGLLHQKEQLVSAKTVGTKISKRKVSTSQNSRRSLKTAQPEEHQFTKSVRVFESNIKKQTNKQEPAHVCGLAARLSAVVSTCQAATFELEQRSAINVHNKVYRFLVQTLTASLCKQATRLD